MEEKDEPRAEASPHPSVLFSVDRAQGSRQRRCISLRRRYPNCEDQDPSLHHQRCHPREFDCHLEQVKERERVAVELNLLLFSFPSFPKLFVFSAANSDLYIGSRTLFALAVEGQAPAIFKKVSKRGIPLPALLFCTAFCGLAYCAVSSSDFPRTTGVSILTLSSPESA